LPSKVTYRRKEYEIRKLKKDKEGCLGRMENILKWEKLGE
jgi:hypothetical protein